MPVLGSHPLWELDSKYAHSLAESGGEGFYQGEAHAEENRFGLLENRRLVVLLVELLGQFVCVVGDDGR